MSLSWSRRPAAAWVALPLLACVSIKPVEVRYQLHASKEQTKPAAQAAIQRLGWKGAPFIGMTLSDGRLLLISTPRQRPLPLFASASPEGGLVVSSYRLNSADSLQPAAEVLAQAVRQQLDPSDVPPGAQALSTRWMTLTVALDLLDPLLGGLYAHQGDPLTLACSGSSLATQEAARAGVDVVGAGLAVGGLVAWNDGRRDRRAGTILLGSAAAVLVVERAYTIANDLLDVSARNQVASSGFVFNLAAPP